MDKSTKEGRFWFVSLCNGFVCFHYAIVSEAIIGEKMATLKALQMYCNEEGGNVNATFSVQADLLLPDND